ncbi:hypothetical protein [Methanomethylovorans sp.]|uniref:hypothetical protein n=1 Tax=Methanomethylovorans sp. TaxID=2758717 RepID=UPI00345E6543
MQKYDIEQLLKQQKSNVFQSIITIIVALAVSITASILLIQYPDVARSKATLCASILAVFILCIYPLLNLLIHLNDYITVKKEKMTLLFAFENTRNCPELIKFNGYPFSIHTASDWTKFIQIDENCKKIKSSYNDEPFFEKAVFDLVLYTTLMRISNNHHNFFFTKDYLNWIIYQDQAIRNNIFVNLFHSKQIEYEKHSRDGIEIGEKHSRDGIEISAWTYIPFNITFPHDIDFQLEKTDKTQIPKIILKNDIIRITINFDKEACFDKTFAYTLLKPGNRFKSYDEKCFVMTIEFEIKKYSFFKTNENEIDKFWSWGDGLIEDLKGFCDWKYYEGNFQRSQIQEILNKLGYMNWEMRIENYHNFEDNPHGKVKKLLRYTISPFFKERRDAIGYIVDMKNEIPTDLIENVINRLLLLASDINNDTGFKAAEALGNMRDVIPTNLHENVVNTLIKTLDDKNTDENIGLIKENSIQSLILLFSIVPPLLKKKICDTIIKAYISNNQDSFYKHELSKALDEIYVNISPSDQKQYENEFFQKISLPSSDAELISGLKFYAAVAAFINTETTRKVITTLLQINPSNSDILCEYLNTLANLWATVKNEYINEIFTKIYSFLVYEEPEFRIKVIHKFLCTTFFVEYLNGEQKDKILHKLIEYSNSENDNLKNLSLESLAHLSLEFSGHEDEITNLLLDSIKNVNLSPENLFWSHITICFDNISIKVQPETVRRIITFINENPIYIEFSLLKHIKLNAKVIN